MMLDMHERLLVRMFSLCLFRVTSCLIQTRNCEIGRIFGVRTSSCWSLKTKVIKLATCPECNSVPGHKMTLIAGEADMHN